MPPEITISSKHFVAVATRERLLLGVGEQEGFEVGPLVEGFPARRTSMRALLHMEDLVNRKRPRLAKSLSTFVALERLFFGMNVSVVP